LETLITFLSYKAPNFATLRALAEVGWGLTCTIVNAKRNKKVFILELKVVTESLLVTRKIVMSTRQTFDGRRAHHVRTAIMLPYLLIDTT